MNINNNNNRGPIHNGGINPSTPNASKGKQKDALRNLCEILKNLGNNIEEQKLSLDNLANILNHVSDNELKDFFKRFLK